MHSFKPESASVRTRLPNNAILKQKKENSCWLGKYSQHGVADVADKAISQKV
jgi:hypothetical protein